MAGLEGDPLQAFGPALARRGVAVLAPDALTFEDGRAHTSGAAPDEDADWPQHSNALAYRLIDGDTLMRKVLDDRQSAVSVLSDLTDLTTGVVGHSFSGLAAVYLAALDERCRFACLSGSVASIEARRGAGTGINMFEVVPELARHQETHDLLSAIAPRPTLMVSATDDPYATDADRVAARTHHPALAECRVRGGHALDPDRFDVILDWVAGQAAVSSANGAQPSPS